MPTQLLFVGCFLFSFFIIQGCTNNEHSADKNDNIENNEMNESEVDSSSIDNELNEEFEALENELIEPVWSRKTDGQNFTIELPRQMHEEDSLNVEANLQYAYIERLENEVKENYIIVLVHNKKELAKETKEYDIDSYNEIAVDNLLLGKVNYEKLNPKKELSIDKKPAIINELKAGIQMMDGRVVDIFYMLGVVEGEKAFYQILTWTTWGQKDYFKSDMKRMIKSFKEK